MSIRRCSHMAMPQRCEISSCPFYDNRPLSDRLFGSNSDSALAAKLFRTDRAAYDLARQEAISNGRLPVAIIPKCLQDDI
jgi:hypothetical protein